MKYRMITTTKDTHLSSINRKISRLVANNDILRVFLVDTLGNAMEAIDDPDIKGKSPKGYIENLMTNKLGDFSKRIILTYKENETVIGILIALPLKDPHMNTYNIYTVGVNKPYRNKGIGTQLILSLKEILRGQGVDFVSLDVNETNQNAIRLYKRMGFSLLT